MQVLTPSSPPPRPRRLLCEPRPGQSEEPGTGLCTQLLLPGRELDVSADIIPHHL